MSNEIDGWRILESVALGLFTLYMYLTYAKERALAVELRSQVEAAIKAKKLPPSGREIRARLVQELCGHLDDNNIFLSEEAIRAMDRWSEGKPCRAETEGYQYKCNDCKDRGSYGLETSMWHAVCCECGSGRDLLEDAHLRIPNADARWAHIVRPKDLGKVFLEEDTGSAYVLNRLVPGPDDTFGFR